MTQAEPNKAPDQSGRFAKAWAVTAAPALAAKFPAYLSGHLVFAPMSHPVWPWKHITLVALRDFQDIPKATILRMGATHEITVQSLDPDVVIGDPENGGPFAYLRPADIVYQFKAPGDAHAQKLFDDAMFHVVHAGMLVPDCDHRSTWARTLDMWAERLFNMPLS